MKQLDLKDLNLGQAVWTPEHGQQAQAQMRQQIESANLNTTMMVEIGQWAERVLENPKQFPAFQAWLKQQGLPDSEIPEAPDFQELSAMAAMGRVSGEIDSAAAESRAAAPSGAVDPAAVAAQGRSGDTQLAHINPEEAAMLQAAGGMGTINPATGLPEYGFFRDLWNGIKKVAKAVAPFVLPVAAIFFPALIPAIGTYLGASAALAPIIGAAAISGGMTALSGGSIKDVLTSAALTGLGSYLAPIVGGYVGELTGITNPGILSSIGSAAIAGGATALRGGTVSQILTAAATGGAASYLGQVASNAINSGGITNTKITQKVFDDAVFAAADAKGLADAGLSKMQIQQTLVSTGLAGDVAATAAAGAAAGQTADQIAVTVSNRYASLTPAATRSTQPSLYNSDATGVTNSLIGGANTRALEQVQRYEDGMLRTEQGRTIMATARAQGLTSTALTNRIVNDLIADGVDPTSARFIGENLSQGKTTGAISGGIVDTLPNAKLFGDKPAAAPVAAPVAVTPAAPAAPVAPAAVYTADTYADAEFLMADVKQLYEQGIGAGQIVKTLEQAGYSTNAANNAVGTYQAGRTVDSMAKTLATTYARGGKPDGLAPVVAAPGMTETVTPGTGTNPVARVELTPPAATTPVAPSGPTNLAPNFDPNNTPPGMTIKYAPPNTPEGNYDNWSSYNSNMTETVTPGTGTNPVAQVTLTAPPPPMNLSEAEFLAADAAQLAAQTGNNVLAIEQNLVYSGVDPVIAATVANMAALGIPVQTMTQQLTGMGSLYDPAASVTRPINAPAAPAPRPETDASFAAADAAQLHQQGLTQAQIESTLLYSGVDAMVAADAAQAAATGYNAATIEQLITQSGTTVVGTPPVIYAGDTPQAPLPGYGGPPGSAPPAGPVPMTPAEIGAIVATPIINNAANPPAPAPATGYNFTPQAADPRWSQPLQYPGLNPGMIGAGVRPAYATTSPVQSQFYWGRQPQFDQVSDLSRYNQVPGMPAQPFGLQQSFFEQPTGAAPLAPATPAAYNPAYTPATTPGYPVMAQPQMTMNKFGQLVPVDPLERTGTFAAAPGVAPQASQYTPIT